MPNSQGERKKTRNKLSNDPRERGISPPQRSIESFDEGQTVHLRIDPSIPEGRFHPRFNGLTGTVVGQQGGAYKVEVADGNATKTLIANPAHLTAEEE